jgi:hypothetical protein
MKRSRGAEEQRRRRRRRRRKPEREIWKGQEKNLIPTVSSIICISRVK